MKRVAILLVLAGCVGERNGGNGVTSKSELPAQLPDESTLCKLTVGYDVDSANGLGGSVLGTNSDDVRAVLGEPEKRTDTEFTYDWCVGYGCVKQVTVTLTFKELDRCYRDTGKPITPSYWLSDMKVEGFDLPKCLVAGSEMADNCPECIPVGEIAECK